MPANSDAPSATKVTLGCSKCGASLPDEAQFCLKCGKPVSTPAREVVVEVLPPANPRPRRKRRVVPWVLLAAALALIGWIANSDNPFAQGVQEMVGWKHDQTILDATFSLTPHNFRYYKFSLPEGSVNVGVVGQFTAASDNNNNGNRKDKDQAVASDNGIDVYVLSEPAFTIWQNGYATRSLYESGKVAEGTVQTELPAGAGIYYLVFSNKSSPKVGKTVHASVLLRYKSWLPEWFRRMKNRFWNWIGA